MRGSTEGPWAADARGERGGIGCVPLVPPSSTERNGIAVLLAIALAQVVPAAAEAAPGDAPEPEPESRFTARGHVEWISAAGGTAFRDTDVNPGNQVLALPQLAGRTELRPHLVVEYGSALKGVARPRLVLQASKASAGGAWQPETSAASAEWTELYASWRLDDRVAIAYGLQNFQWGPGELLSPSNRIFHETGLFRDPLYVVRGKDLARVNVSIAAAWSAVVLAEVAPNGEAPFVAGEPFEPKAQVKVEWSGHGGAYGGATAGAAQRSRGWFGEYAALPLGAGVSVYADAVHTVGRRAWVPIDDGAGGAAFAQSGMDTRRLETLALAGVRWELEGGADVRLEAVHDDAGWTRRELALSSVAARAPVSDPALLAAWLDPGFELPGRDLAYASLRIPELPPAKRTQVQLRYLRCLTDGSGVAFATATLDATDSTVAFVSAAATHGAQDGALSRLARAMVTAGAVVTW